MCQEFPRSYLISSPQGPSKARVHFSLSADNEPDWHVVWDIRIYEANTPDDVEVKEVIVPAPEKAEAIGVLEFEMEPDRLYYISRADSPEDTALGALAVRWIETLYR